jgi:hypothetical protein
MSGLNLIYVAAGTGFDCVIWGVVIAVFVISQIAKSRKKFTESAPQQQPKPQDKSEDPAEELRKFLEGLGQAPEQAPPPPPPPPPPVPVAAPPPLQARRVASAKPRARVAAPVRVHAEPARRAAVPPPPEEATPDDAAVLARYRAERIAAAVPAGRTSKWHAVLTAELKGADRHPLRKAFLLREVLGAPASLRRREVVYPLT